MVVQGIHIAVSDGLLPTDIGNVTEVLSEEAAPERDNFLNCEVTLSDTVVSSGPN